MSTIYVLGSGGFGTSLSVMLSNAGHAVTLWGYDPQEQAQIKAYRENIPLLKGVRIPEEVKIVDKTDGIEHADVVFIATPTVGVRSTARAVAGKLKEGAVVACIAKGLEPGSYKLMSDVIAEELPGVPEVSLSGPSHAEEVARGVVTAMVAASRDLAAAQVIQDLTAGTNVRIYTSEDVVGVQLGGALKNVIAFAAGILDGLKLGDNTKAALMTRGMHEISRLGAAMGAKPETFSGLSGVGDLIVTCCSVHSRNRRCGVFVGEGMSVPDAIKAVGMVVEGVIATDCAFRLAQQLGIEMPITTQIYRVIQGEVDPRTALSQLLERPLKHESEQLWLNM